MCEGKKKTRNMFRRALSVTSTRVSFYPTSTRWLHVSPIVSKTTTEKAAEVADKVCAHLHALLSSDEEMWVSSRMGDDRLTSRLAKASHPR